MAQIELNNENFQLNLLFEGEKNPSEAFDELKDVFQALSALDEVYIASIANGIHCDYSIQSIEYSSIKTWIAQRIREVPDEAIKEFDWKKLVGHFLLKLKYLVLKYLESNSEIDSKDSIERLAKEIEVEKTKIINNDKYLLNEVNLYTLINTLEKMVAVLGNLKEKERIEFKSIDGSAILNRRININKAKILWELGDTNAEHETTEILKIKKIDLLSNNSTWTFKLGTKTIDAKIIDRVWLDKYHSREFPLLPEDSLKVKLKVIYINRPDGSVLKNVYEITEVLKRIDPEDGSFQMKLI
ncbi:hypothetical protein [Mucilaginibacter sp.]|uniref:hypothetical protein n=1 Tax=Mucilaginibacter sp. TaxID=1882438 RepID=UPI003B00521A